MPYDRFVFGVVDLETALAVFDFAGFTVFGAVFVASLAVIRVTFVLSWFLLTLVCLPI